MDNQIIIDFLRKHNNLISLDVDKDLILGIVHGPTYYIIDYQKKMLDTGVYSDMQTISLLKKIIDPMIRNMNLNKKIDKIKNRV